VSFIQTRRFFFQPHAHLQSAVPRIFPSWIWACSCNEMHETTRHNTFDARCLLLLRKYSRTSQCMEAGTGTQNDFHVCWNDVYNAHDSMHLLRHCPVESATQIADALRRHLLRDHSGTELARPHLVKHIVEFGCVRHRSRMSFRLVPYQKNDLLFSLRIFFTHTRRYHGITLLAVYAISPSYSGRRMRRTWAGMRSISRIWMRFFAPLWAA